MYVCGRGWSWRVEANAHVRYVCVYIVSEVGICGRHMQL